MNLSPPRIDPNLDLVAMHKDDKDRKTHEAMDFKEGWTICAHQLVELMKSLRK